MVAIFFMKTGLIKSIPLERGGTVTKRWYVDSCLPQVFETVSEWRQKIGLRGLILHDDNARPHRAGIVNEFLAENRVEPYRNPPYSPDLTREGHQLINRF
ncbi:unnamed protein product [Didymodactylos carnosus]|uniref:Transposase n=1 Tax=Didymodactylos carnosus TaxID=1234261 RepID=A0A815XTY0_9BILA|nr:unnamed protein product [Didymodactylos carnosus]CAF4423566.1 unnamed protein product [Didymodactylos carnosus]